MLPNSVGIKWKFLYPELISNLLLVESTDTLVPLIKGQVKRKKHLSVQKYIFFLLVLSLSHQHSLALSPFFASKLINEEKASLHKRAPDHGCNRMPCNLLLECKSIPAYVLI